MAAMAADVRQGHVDAIQVQLFEVINNAFEECARTQQDLQLRMRSSITQIFKKHRHELFPGSFALHEGNGETVPDKDLAFEVPPSPMREGTIATATSSNVLDGIPVVSERYGYPTAANSDKSFRGVVSAVIPEPTGPRGPKFSLKKTKQPKISDVVEEHPRDYFMGSKQSSGLTKDFTIKSLQSTLPSYPFRSSLGSNQSRTVSQCMYLATIGTFVSGRSMADLPRWHRLAEQVLHTQSDLVSRLADFWMSGIQSSSVSSIVDCIVLRGTFLLNLERAYRYAQSGKRERSRSRISRKSLAESTAVAYNLALDVFPIHPSSGLRLCWDILCMCVCIYDVVILPLTVFDFDDETHAVKNAMELYGAIFWTLDILMSFCTAHFDGHTIQRNFKFIAECYLRSWFFVDFAIVVNEWLSIIFLLSSFGALRTAKFLKIFIRGLRVIRLLKLSSHYKFALLRMNSEITLSIMKIGTQTISVALMCHYVACGWYALHVVNDVDTTWVDKYISPHASMSYRYTTSLQWAFTQLCPASINVQPVNTAERVYNIIIILIAMVVFSSFVSSITVSMNHMRDCRLSAIKREFQLRRFLSEHQVSNKLTHTIWSFIKRSNQRSLKSTKPEDVIALNSLPEHILECLYTDVFQWQLEKHPLFRFYSRLEPQCMAKLCRTGIEMRILLSSDVLWHDLIVNRMLFVRNGMLIYNTESTHETFHVEAGEWCCEEALWNDTPRIDSPFWAGLSGCELLMVKPDVFQTVAKKYAQNMNSFRFLARYGEEFTRSFNEASHNHEYRNLLFNERRVCLGILRDLLSFFQSNAAEEDSESSTELQCSTTL